MNATYNLKSNKIFLFISDKGRIQIYTGEKCNPDNWNKKNRRCKKAEPFSDQKNGVLDNLLIFVNETYREAKAKAEPLDIKERVKEYLLKYKEVKPEPEIKENNFFQYFDEFIESKSKTVTRTKKKITQVSIVNFKNIKSQLLEFEKETGNPVTLEGMNSAFYLAFQDWVMNIHGKSINTFGKYTRGLKTFLFWCLDNEITVNLKFRKMEVLQEYVGVKSITQEKLIELYNLDFKSPAIYERLKTDFKVNKLQLVQKIKTLEQMKDVFLFCCYTGLRISDIKTLLPTDIQGDVIIKRMQKTNIECVIPFFDDNIFKPCEIVNKYKGKHRTLMPPCYHINENLHIIEKLLNINFELTSKIGRKTFTTLKLLQGVPARVIMLSTGHQTEKSFNRYVGINPDQLVKAYREKGSFLKVG